MTFWQTLQAIHKNEQGQLLTEWTLVTGTVVVPVGLLGAGAVNMIEIYYYRIVGTICLPFP